MKVTVKGQITIPVALRERFGLRPGTEVEFVAGQETLQVKARKASRKAGRASELWLPKPLARPRLAKPRMKSWP